MSITRQQRRLGPAVIALAAEEIGTRGPWPQGAGSAGLFVRGYRRKCRFQREGVSIALGRPHALIMLGALSQRPSPKGPSTRCPGLGAALPVFLFLRIPPKSLQARR
jgi:hypothetical protein